MEDKVVYPDLLQQTPKFYHPIGAQPTAPNYPDLQSNSSISLSIQNDECCKCNEKLNEYTNVIVRATCGHVYHHACSSGIFDTNPSSICSLCRKEPTENSQFVSITGGTRSRRQKLAMKTLEIVHGMVKDEEDVKNISVSSKTSLDSKSIGAIFRTIDKNYIESKEISMTELLNSGISIEQIYYKIGMQEWSELLNIGFKRKHLKNRTLVNIPFLADKYNVSWETLKKDLQIKIEKMPSYGFDVWDLYSLGINIDTIAKSPDKKKIIYGLGLSVCDLVRLGFTDDHIYEIGITKNDLQPLEWKRKDIFKYMVPNAGVIRRLEL